jgi:hypothetical protein
MNISNNTSKFLLKIILSNTTQEFFKKWNKNVIKRNSINKYIHNDSLIRCVGNDIYKYYAHNKYYSNDINNYKYKKVK